MLEKFENMIFERTWKKAQKKARKKTMPFLVSTKVDIEKWLKVYQGDTSRLDWLISEMLDYTLENESAANSLYVSQEDSGAFSYHLDEMGVFWFSDILQDFFTLNEVRQMWQELKSRNAVVRFYEDVQLYIKSRDTDSLKEYRCKWESIQDNSDTAKEIQKNILTLISVELKSRKC